MLQALVGLQLGVEVEFMFPLHIFPGLVLLVTQRLLQLSSVGRPALLTLR